MADPFSHWGCAATPVDPLLTYVAPYRNPLVAAQRVATLDVLSGGRVTSVSAPVPTRWFRAVGGPRKHRRSTFTSK